MFVFCAFIFQDLNPASLLKNLQQHTAWTILSDVSRATASQTAVQCADLFQRSSSCVEGRNGRLSLHHHGIHRLRPGKLRCLTIIHNYFLQRPDRSTAAERFFGAAPQDLFEWLVQKVPPMGQPAKTRAQGTRVYDA